MDEVKSLIFSHYVGEFQQATQADADIMKTSEQIAYDLQEMATFTTDEIAIGMANFGYKIGFDGERMVWLMKRPPEMLIEE